MNILNCNILYNYEKFLCLLFRFDFSEIENISEQRLVIAVYDSDHGEAPGVKTIVQEKRGLSRLV